MPAWISSKKASLSRVKDAVEEVMGAEAEPGVRLRHRRRRRHPKRGLFKKAEDTIRLLVKFVPLVDGAAVAEAWRRRDEEQARRTRSCAVLLVGPGLAPSRELAAAISEQRRKSRNAGPVLVPVDVRDWEALFPPETPARSAR